MRRFRLIRLGALVVGLALLWNRGDAQTAAPVALKPRRHNNPYVPLAQHRQPAGQYAFGLQCHLGRCCCGVYRSDRGKPWLTATLIECSGVLFYNVKDPFHPSRPPIDPGLFRPG